MNSRKKLDSQPALHVLFLEHLRDKRIVDCKDLRVGRVRTVKLENEQEEEKG